MVAEPAGIGTYVAYGAIIAFLLLIVLVFLRTAFLVLLLWLAPFAELVRRLPLRRRGRRTDGAEL